MAPKRTRTMAAVLLSCALLAVGAPEAFAQLFSRSPRSFDECIAQRMPGTTSDLAAGAIFRACRNMFPEPDLNASGNLVDITSRLVNFSVVVKYPNIPQSGDSTFYSVFHETPGFAVVSITLVAEEGSTTRHFECRIFSGEAIAPNSSGTVACSLFLHGMNVRSIRWTYHKVLAR
ncbi:MAG: hypothetical protein J0653_00030, partial [Deltaproteobacteria bacterium]|nr:hypothetical protein [Deltaproteobacteria bacterium]